MGSFWNVRGLRIAHNRNSGLTLTSDSEGECDGSLREELGLLGPESRGRGGESNTARPHSVRRFLADGGRASIAVEVVANGEFIFPVSRLIHNLHGGSGGGLESGKVERMLGSAS